jgi:hypothetical protein
MRKEQRIKNKEQTPNNKPPPLENLYKRMEIER